MILALIDTLLLEVSAKSKIGNSGFFFFGLYTNCGQKEAWTSTSLFPFLSWPIVHQFFVEKK